MKYGARQENPLMRPPKMNVEKMQKSMNKSENDYGKKQRKGKWN